MPTAIRHIETVPGVALAGFAVPPRELQQRTTKFWGVKGESVILGATGGRDLNVPVIIYDEGRFTTARALSNYLDTNLQNMIGKTRRLTVESLSDHPGFLDCTFIGFTLGPEGIKKDVAGTLGGSFFCLGVLAFRQRR